MIEFLSHLDAFADYFSSVYVDLKPFSIHQSPKVSPESTIINVSSLYIFLSEVFEGLSNMSLDSSHGPDNLPPIVLSKCCYALAHPIYTLFNMSLVQGVFPRLWKSNYVLHVFKSGNRNSIRNYWPISKLNSLPKLFEKIL